jgi:signal transduction histidine kinase
MRRITPLLNFMSRLAARLLRVRNTDPEVVRRGQMLIFLSTALILIALLYLLYFSIHNLQTPGPVPFSDWLSIGLASSHLFTSALIIKLAKEGKTKAGSALWLGWYALTITGVALPRMEVSFHEMTARLLTPIVAAGPLLGAWWSIITAVVVSIFETGIAFVMVPALEPDPLMGAYMRNLLISSTMWLFSSLLERGLSESEALRREADNLRDMALEVTKLNFNLLKNICQQVETPTSLIVGYANLLIRHERTLSREGRRVVEMIRHNSYRLSTAIRETIGLSQLQSFIGGHPAVEFSPSALLADVAAELTPLIRRQGLNLEQVLDPRLPDRCTGYPIPLRYALTRTFQSVISGTQAGGRVTLQARPDGNNRWRISISSTSRGFTQEMLDLFSSTPSQDDTPPLVSGDRHMLGLLLAKELILSIGGSLFVESSPAGGTIITIDLPLETEHPQEELHSLDKPTRDTGAETLRL